MGGWARRVRLAGWKTWRRLWRLWELPFEWVTATFEEQNDLDDVQIVIFHNEDHTHPVKTITTADGGTATASLNTGDYWFKASKEHYEEYTSSKKEIDEDKTIDFTMVAKEYTVTFDEQNDEEDVEIAIYNDEDRTDPVEGSPITTGEGGTATIDLTYGTYYYTASKDGYVDEEGEFTVEEDKTVEFTMLAED